MKPYRILLGVLFFASLSACSADEEPFMTLSQKRFTVDSDGGTVDVRLAVNVHYTVVNESEWTSITEAAAVEDSVSYTVTIAPNTETSQRKARIKFIGDEVTPLALDIIQKAMVPTGISTSELSVPAGATSASFSILGDKAWTASSDNPDFVLSATSGEGEAEITVRFPENLSDNDVSARITVIIKGQSHSLVITHKGISVIDLSGDGTANCYVVGSAGNYKFKATIAGNGVVPESQVGKVSGDLSLDEAKVLWCTYNTAEAPSSSESLVRKVRLDGEYVYFETSDAVTLIPGNVVIAGYKAGTIVWTWHIWLTSLGDNILSSTAEWLDRNLGALAPSTYMTTDPLSMGLHFQFGRKDPFRGAYTFTEPLTGTNDIVTQGENWPEPVLADQDNGSIAYTIANPMTFLYSEDSKYNNKDWVWKEQYNDLWGGSVEASKGPYKLARTAKTMFDPCPVGYAVPSSQQFNNAAGDYGISKSSIIVIGDTGIYGIGTENFWLVYAGGPLYNTGCLDTGSSGPGKYSWYATSCTSGVNMLCARSHTTAFSWGGATSARTAGYSVRCVKE